MIRIALISVATVIGLAMYMIQPLSAVAGERTVDECGQPSARDVHVYCSEARRYLTIDKSQAKLQFALEWQIANLERFQRATGGSVERASQRLADVLEDRLRDSVGRVTANALPGRLAAIAYDAVASSREPASELGIEIMDLRLSEK